MSKVVLKFPKADGKCPFCNADMSDDETVEHLAQAHGVSFLKINPVIAHVRLTGNVKASSHAGPAAFVEKYDMIQNMFSTKIFTFMPWGQPGEWIVKELSPMSVD